MYQRNLLTRSSRTPHSRMIANVESIEILLQVAFGRGIKYLSTSPDDATHEQSSHLGEKLCVAALKCYSVRLNLTLKNISH